MKALILLLALALASSSGCAALLGGGLPTGKEAGNWVEDTCVQGKLTDAGARVLNDSEGETLVNWHFEYTVHYGKAGEHTRLISAACAEGLKRMLTEEWRDKSEG
jgi:hypothetical protein